MTKTELKKVVKNNTRHELAALDIMDAVEKYSKALIAAKPIVIGRSEQVCGCGNELTEKEVFYETCLKCGRIS